MVSSDTSGSLQETGILFRWVEQLEKSSANSLGIRRQLLEDKREWARRTLRDEPKTSGPRLRRSPQEQPPTTIRQRAAVRRSDPESQSLPGSMAGSQRSSSLRRSAGEGFAGIRVELWSRGRVLLVRTVEL